LADGAPNPMGMAASVEGVIAVRAEHGLPPVDRLADLLDMCETVLVTCPAALDEREDEWAANVRHVGPVLEEAGPDAGWAPPDGEGPLVVASMGTTAMGEGPVLAGWWRLWRTSRCGSRCCWAATSTAGGCGCPPTPPSRATSATRRSCPMPP
jgi:hypothetical protein